MTRMTIRWGLVRLHCGVQGESRAFRKPARGVRGRPGSSRADRGATTVEYALMVSLIAVVIIAAVTIFGQNVEQLFHVPASAL